MNALHFNLLPSYDSITLDHDFTPFSQNGFRFGQGGSANFNSVTGQSVRVRWADAVNQTFSSTSLSGYNFRQLPTGTRQNVSVDVIHPDNLREVRYVNQRLHSLPENLRLLRNLSTLYLQNNLLSDFPPVIVQVPLNTLSIMGGNGITSLPPAALTIPTLRNLALGNENFTILPDVFNQSNVTYLQLTGKNAYTLPASIVNSKIHTVLFDNGTTHFPANFSSWQSLKQVRFGQLTSSYINGGRVSATIQTGKAFNSVFTSHTGIEELQVVNLYDIQSQNGLENMTSLRRLYYASNTGSDTNQTTFPTLGNGLLPANWKNLVLLKTIGYYGLNLRDLAVVNNLVDSYYAIAVAQAPMTGVAADPWRGVNLTIASYGSAGAMAPTGIRQQPAGYIKGETNGTPASQKEKIWVLADQYGWSVQTN